MTTEDQHRSRRIFYLANSFVFPLVAGSTPQDAGRVRDHRFVVPVFICANFAGIAAPRFDPLRQALIHGIKVQAPLFAGCNSCVQFLARPASPQDQASTRLLFFLSFLDNVPVWFPDLRVFALTNSPVKINGYRPAHFVHPFFFCSVQQGTVSEHGLRCAAASNCGKSAHSPETCRRCARLSELLSPASFLFPALPSFLRSFLQNLHLSFSVFLSPLFGHCICNTRKCFCSVLGPVSRKHPFVLLSMLFAVRARRTPCCNRCHNVCWKQRWQIFYPKAGLFTVRVSILIRLYRLCVLRQAENATWDRIFYANPWNIRPPEAHKKIAALNSFHDTICLKHMTFPKVSCPCVAQVCTRRVRNEQIPRINIMSLVVHCDDLPPRRAVTASPRICHSGCPPDGS